MIPYNNLPPLTCVERRCGSIVGEPAASPHLGTLGEAVPSLTVSPNQAGGPGRTHRSRPFSPSLAVGGPLTHASALSAARVQLSQGVGWQPGKASPPRPRHRAQHLLHVCHSHTNHHDEFLPGVCPCVDVSTGPPSTGEGRTGCVNCSHPS